MRSRRSGYVGGAGPLESRALQQTTIQPRMFKWFRKDKTDAPVRPPELATPPEESLAAASEAIAADAAVPEVGALTSGSDSELVPESTAASVDSTATTASTFEREPESEPQPQQEFFDPALAFSSAIDAIAAEPRPAPPPRLSERLAASAQFLP